MTQPQQPPEDEFTFAEYVLAAAAIQQSFNAIAYTILAPFQGLALSAATWTGVLAALYPHVERARYESAEIARRFYDSQRYIHVPREVIYEPVFSAERFIEEFGVDIRVDDRSGVTLPRIVTGDRHDVLLAHYDPDWFAEAMEAARENFSKERATAGSLLKMLYVADKEIENGGRRTLLDAAKSDKVVRGWARVAGGGESCAFCEMLISRGPVYKEASDSGLMLENVEAEELWNRINDTGNDALLDELMNRWHENCDCKVVPVFKGATTEWPGYLDYRRAEKRWSEVTGDYYGEDKLRAFRAYLEGRELPEPTRGFRPNKRTA